MRVKNAEINLKRNSFIGLVRDVMCKKHKVGIAAVIGAVILLLINFYIIPPMYASTAKLYIVNSEENGTTTSGNVNISRMLTRDFTELITSNTILEKVIKDLELDMELSSLKDSVTINTPKGTRMLEVRVVSNESELSMNIVNALVKISGEEYTKVARAAKMNVLEYGSPPLASEKPDVLRIVLLGACYGSLMSILFIIRFNKQNERIVTAEDVEYWLGLSTLGELPLDKEKAVRTAVLMQPGTV